MPSLVAQVLLMTVAAQAQAAPVRFDVVYPKSVIAIRTDKSGLFSAFGHRHGILATGFSARICADPQSLANASVAVQVPTAGLRIDTPEARRAARLEGSGPKEEDIPTIQQKMLSPANLAAAQFPEVRFESTSAALQGDSLRLDGTVTIRDRSAHVAVPLRVLRDQGAFRFRGEFEVKQTDFGIRPESVGGVVKVADRVAIVLDIVAAPTGESCR